MSIHLAADAGWLETTAAPGQNGNSVISAHVTDIYGWDGPFAQLAALELGDAIYIHASGQVYTYLVQTVRNVAPDDLSVLEDAGAPVLDSGDLLLSQLRDPCLRCASRGAGSDGSAEPGAIEHLSGWNSAPRRRAVFFRDIA